MIRTSTHSTRRRRRRPAALRTWTRPSAPLLLLCALLLSSLPLATATGQERSQPLPAPLESGTNAATAACGDATWDTSGDSAAIANPLDLGLCHARTGSFGHALLWLERARRLHPQDPRSSEAIRIVRGALLQERLEGERSASVEGESWVIRLWRGLTGLDPLLLLVVAALFIWLAVLLGRKGTPHPSQQADPEAPPPFRSIRLLLLSLALLAIAGWFVTPHLDEWIRPAILLSDDPGVAWAPDAAALQQPSPWFREGSIVRVLGEEGGWTEVEAVGGVRAWVRSESVAPIGLPASGWDAP